MRFEIQVKADGRWATLVSPMGHPFRYESREEAELMLRIACPIVLNDDEKRVEEVQP